jgi:purine-binding chemotaxis protein CheW
MRIPGPVPELLGLAGFRGVIVPVYDLPALLRYGALQSAPGALVLTDTSPAVALAFEAIPEHFTVRPAEVVPERIEGKNVRGAVAFRGLIHPILDVSALVVAIRVRAEQHPAHQGEERL